MVMTTILWCLVLAGWHDIARVINIIAKSDNIWRAVVLTVLPGTPMRDTNPSHVPGGGGVRPSQPL